MMWDAATGRRTYLPRLGGPLTGLATCPEDPAKYALAQADNTIRVVRRRYTIYNCTAEDATQTN